MPALPVVLCEEECLLALHPLTNHAVGRAAPAECDDRYPFESSAGTDVVFMTLRKDLGMGRELAVQIVNLQDREVLHVHSV